MKIGIVTYHRAHNYGAVLQCYALQEVIKSFGHDVCIIDYRQESIEKLYNPSKFSIVKKKLFHPRSLIGLRIVFNEFKKKRSLFEEFTERFLNLSSPCSFESIPDCDVYIVGSDQMWSIDCVGDVIDPVYFGQFSRKKDSKLIGFSISSNLHSLNILADKLPIYINNFDNISFRESEIAQTIYERTSILKEVTIDPTLCGKPSIWDGLINHNWSKQKYLVLYHVKLRFANIVYKLLLQKAHTLAEKHGWKVVDLSTGEYSVLDFVSAIKYAQCVITSSFHATVFSIIFSKSLFAVKLHDGNDARYVDLLKNLRMDNALVDLDFSEIDPEMFNYTEVHERLLEYRKSSNEYLIRNI